MQTFRRIIALKGLTGWQGYWTSTWTWTWSRFGWTEMRGQELAGHKSMIGLLIRRYLLPILWALSAGGFANLDCHLAAVPGHPFLITLSARSVSKAAAQLCISGKWLGLRLEPKSWQYLWICLGLAGDQWAQVRIQCILLLIITVLCISRFRSQFRSVFRSAPVVQGHQEVLHFRASPIKGQLLKWGSKGSPRSQLAGAMASQGPTGSQSVRQKTGKIDRGSCRSGLAIDMYATYICIS